MNGARTDPCANTSSAPTSTMMMMMGSRSNVFRTFMKAHSSLIKPELLIASSPLSELAFHATRLRLGRVSFDPEPVAAHRMYQRRAAHDAQPQGDRREYHEIDHAHEDRGRDLRQQVRQPHPGLVHRP